LPIERRTTQDKKDFLALGMRPLLFDALAPAAQDLGLTQAQLMTWVINITRP
jgi:hypothetical protein